MKFVLSTSNVMSGGSPIRRSPTTKSNTEFVSSLRANFEQHYSSVPVSNGTNTPTTATNGAIPSQPPPPSDKVDYRTWTALTPDKQTLEIPRLDFSQTALQEEREAYDITVKLFYLPQPATSHVHVEQREQQTREALALVLKELHMPSIDLLIVSFPGIYFDEEEDCPDKISTRGPVESSPEALEDQIATWRVLEKLCEEGLAKKLGVAEFGYERLLGMVQNGALKVRPSVDQINLRDCCSVPKQLLALARKEGVELLVHNDCSNILPRGTVRELLGPGEDGAGVLAEAAKTGAKRKSLHGEEGKNGILEGDGGAGFKGDVQPLWVVKYTAVVKNRGVVENKGYFAVAEVSP